MRWLLNTLSPIPFPPWFMQLGGRLIVLMTRGRRSGRERSTALLYFDHGTKRYVVASFAGVDQHPARYLNLVAEPHVTAEVHGERTPYVARALDEGVAAELWPFLEGAYAGFRRYRRRTARQIPIVELIPDPDRAVPVAAG